MHKPTHEQEHALALAEYMESMKISAFAGAGKTSTLKLIASALGRPATYIAFNKALVREAKSSMPGIVECKTFHALAYARFGSQLQGRLGARLNGRVVAQELNLQGWHVRPNAVLSTTTQGYILLDSVRRFCKTLDPVLDVKHMATPEIVGLTKADADGIGVQLLDKARALWALMSDMKPGANFPVTHDVYVRLWAQSNPAIRGDYILFDEAQDADNLMLRVLSLQQKPVFFVGDQHQQIYEWRGAVNAMEKINTPHEAKLTMSFRFGQPIADTANRVLRSIGEEAPIIGNPAVASKTGKLEAPTAIVARTNAKVVHELFDQLKCGSTSRIAATGVQQSINFYEAAQKLRDGLGGSGELALFKTYDELKEYATKPEGSDLATYMRLADDHGIDVILNMLRGVRDVSQFPDAELVISTGHRSKGLQWSSVRLCNDFRVPPPPGLSAKELEHWPSPTNEDNRLLYVAMTRARNALDVESLDLRGFDVPRAVPAEQEAAAA